MRTPTVTKEEFLAAIRDGVHSAMWRMITNATDMPSADFFDAIKAGAKEAIDDMDDHHG
jgi:hypothetical protein